MASQRIPTGLSGILAVDKPAGMTSHDVVNTLRRLTGERRIGHAGTLDPLATGLLVVCIGPATRLADYLMVGVKTYEARICFGTATNTDDAEGEVVKTAPLPQELKDLVYTTTFLTEQVGEIQQIPPAFSAIKKEGVTAYKAARSGKALELEPRPVQLYEASLDALGEDHWDVTLTVSKGFYVRSFARDLGEQMGSAAHLGALRRTRSGHIASEQACRLDDITSGEALPFVDPVAALGLPVIELTAAEAQVVQHGAALTLSRAQIRQSGQRAAAGPSAPPPSQLRSLVSVVCDNKLLALYQLAGSSGLARPKVVILGGIPLPQAPED